MISQQNFLQSTIQQSDTQPQQLQQQGYSNSNLDQSVSKSAQLNSSVVKTPQGVGSVVAQPKPQTKVTIENMPIQKYYTDYEPIVTHQHVAYERDYEEQHQTSLGVSVSVAKTMTDYQTIQFTNFQPIQVPYTDYKQIENRTEFIPRIRYEIITEYIPANQVDKIIEQHPFKVLQMAENGEQISMIENKVQQKHVTKQDFITQQRVQQIVEYEEINSQRVLSESTVLQPNVLQPCPSQIVVQQSIHEPQLNTPDVQPQRQQYVTVIQQPSQHFKTEKNFYPQVQQDARFINEITPTKSPKTNQSYQQNRQISQL